MMSIVGVVFGGSHCIGWWFFYLPQHSFVTGGKVKSPPVTKLCCGWSDCLLVLLFYSLCSGFYFSSYIFSENYSCLYNHLTSICSVTSFFISSRGFHASPLDTGMLRLALVTVNGLLSYNTSRTSLFDPNTNLTCCLYLRRISHYWFDQCALYNSTFSTSRKFHYFRKKKWSVP
jgi:hypothetical protein